MARKATDRKNIVKWYQEYLGRAYYDAMVMDGFTNKQIVKLGTMGGKKNIQAVYKEGLDVLSKYCDSIILNLNRAVSIIEAEAEKKKGNKKLAKAKRDFQDTVSRIYVFKTRFLAREYEELRAGANSDKAHAIGGWLNIFYAIQSGLVEDVSQLVEKYGDLIRNPYHRQ